MSRQVLSDSEAEWLIKALLRSQGTVTEEECQTLIVWAQHARIDYCLLKLVLDGKVAPMIEDGTIKFRAVSPEAIR